MIRECWDVSNYMSLPRFHVTRDGWRGAHNELRLVVCRDRGDKLAVEKGPLQDIADIRHA